MNGHCCGNEEIEDRGGHDGASEHPSSRQLRCDDSARNLRHQITPEEGAVNHARNAMIPFYVMALKEEEKAKWRKEEEERQGREGHAKVTPRN